MTTATAPSRTAPTEAEIREAVAAMPDEVDSDEVSQMIWAMLGPVRYQRPDTEPLDGSIGAHCLWRDLRPSQEARLEELLEGVYTRTDAFVANELVAAIRGFVVEAAITFAAEFPDAPRPDKR